ncbi:MAG: hypothetical protein WCA49_19980 [Candidatus Sulfotelmatobacter sp.]
MNVLSTSPALPAKRIHAFRLRLPVLLFWLLLLPYAPLLLLVLFIVCPMFGVNPFRATAALFRLFAALKGFHVEVQTSQVSIVLSLF